MLGSIVSRLASPTQDGMKHPEMHKKAKVRKKMEVKKKLGEKNLKKKKIQKTKVGPARTDN